VISCGRRSGTPAAVRSSIQLSPIKICIYRKGNFVLLNSGRGRRKAMTARACSHPGSCHDGGLESRAVLHRRQHAAQNLADVLNWQAHGLSPPIQKMSDALSSNAPKLSQTH